MKIIIKVISKILLIIVFLSIIDLVNIFNGNNPIFVIEEKLDNLNEKYSGILFDVYNCKEYSAMQIKFKWNKYSCPLNNVNEDEVITNNNKQIAKLTLVGDLLFEQPFYDAIEAGYNKDEYFSLVKNYFEEDDLSIGNMEVVIGNENLKTSGVGYNFCAPEYIGHLVNNLDFEVLGTANNHAFDRGIEGLNSTLDFFNNNTDIITVGTYKDKFDRDNLRVLDINGIKFGILSYTYGTNQKPNDSDKNLIGYYRDPSTKKVTDEYKDILKNEITALKEKNDVIIVMMHWGSEFTYIPNKEQREMALFLNELGVDIIVGSHSHSIQPIEVIEGQHKTLVYYSLGNFLSADDDIARTKLGEETFDNAYQTGLLSTLNVIKDDNKVIVEDVNTEIIVNYFDKKMNNFKLIPFKEYNDSYEKTHYRYEKGLNKEFISNMYKSVIGDEYRN